MKLWDYDVLAGKFRKVPAICRNNAGSVAHSVARVTTSCDGNAMISKKTALPLREKYCPCIRSLKEYFVRKISKSLQPATKWLCLLVTKIILQNFTRHSKAVAYCNTPSQIPKHWARSFIETTWGSTSYHSAT